MYSDRLSTGVEGRTTAFSNTQALKISVHYILFQLTPGNTCLGEPGSRQNKENGRLGNRKPQREARRKSLER